MLANDVDQVRTLFPAPADLVWTVVNLLLWLLISAGIVYLIVYLRRLFVERFCGTPHA